MTEALEESAEGRRALYHIVYQRMLAIPEEEEDGENYTTVSDSEVITHAQLIETDQPLPRYTIEDALQSAKMYEHTFMILIYSPHEDTFFGLYSKRHYWVSGCEKL